MPNNATRSCILTAYGTSSSTIENPLFDANVKQIVDGCLATSLPQIAGGDATWCLSPNLPLAVIAQQGPTFRLMSAVPPEFEQLDVADNRLRLHFSYLAQLDPQIVFDILSCLTLGAD